MSEPVIGIATFPVDEARKIARALVESRRAACVSVLPAMTSFYWWQGELSEDAGMMLIIKTTRESLPAVEASIRENTNEEIFELLAVDVTGGNGEYVEWLQSEVAEPLK